MPDDPNFKARQVLNGLIDWAESMGGFSAPVWKEAREYRDSLFPAEPDKPPTKRYRVEGTVHLADGFSAVFKAASKDDAGNLAKMWVLARPWPDADIQEVCVQSVQEETQ